MKLKGKKILVTGADGFIGSHLVEYLVEMGHSVKAFVLYNSMNSFGWLDTVNPDILRRLEVFAGDIRDPHGVRAALKGCDVVFHLAALIAIPYSYHSPDTYVETNIRGTLNLLQACREIAIERFVHTSSSEVYGSARFVPISESHPLQGQSPYSASKIGADHLAQSFFHSFNIPVVTVRPFNTFGPRQSARAVIPTIITQLVAGNDEIKLGALHPTREFNYIRDTVRGFVTIAESESTVGKVLNVGNNYEISIRDLVDLIAKLMDRNVKILADDQRLRPPGSEVDRLVSDNSRVRELTGWVPEYQGLSGLSRGLRETIAWFCDSRNLSRYKTDIYNI